MNVNLKFLFEGFRRLRKNIVPCIEDSLIRNSVSKFEVYRIFMWFLWLILKTLLVCYFHSKNLSIVCFQEFRLSKFIVEPFCENYIRFLYCQELYKIRVINDPLTLCVVLKCIFLNNKCCHRQIVYHIFNTLFFFKYCIKFWKCHGVFNRFNE